MDNNCLYFAQPTKKKIVYIWISFWIYFMLQICFILIDLTYFAINYDVKFDNLLITTSFFYHKFICRLFLYFL